MKNEALSERRQKRKDEIIRRSAAFFLENPIEQSSMEDIADAVEVGVASLYRYFGTKTHLLIEVGTLLWEEKLKKYFLPEPDESLPAHQALKIWLDRYIDLFHKEPGFLRFLEGFDNFMSQRKVDPGLFNQYQKNLHLLDPSLYRILERGMAEGSIRHIENPGRLLTTLIHALIALSQKLLIRGNILPEDRRYSPEEQLAELLEMGLAYLTPADAPAP